MSLHGQHSSGVRQKLCAKRFVHLWHLSNVHLTSGHWLLPTLNLGEATFAVAWAQGRTMTPEQALAVQEQEMASAPTTIVGPPSPTHPAGLTAREVQVLRLVAKGLTNSEIAEELGLSEKTIAHHLTHIFNKTTCENRAAAAAFAIRHGLA